MYLSASVVGFGLRGRGRSWGVVALIAAATLAVVAAVSLPYLQKQAGGQLELPPEFLEEYHRFVPSQRMVALGWVGFGTLVLGALGVLALPLHWTTDRLRAARMLSLAFCAVAGFALARGPGGFLDGWVAPYRWLSVLIPGFDRMRSPPRFGTVSSFGLSALAGFALAEVLRRLRSRSNVYVVRPVALVLAVAAVLAPVIRLPGLKTFLVATGPRVPDAYRWLAEHGGGGPLLELPIGPSLGVNRDLIAARAMYFSTYHWLPLINGYTGYPPTAYALLENYAEQLPSVSALRFLAFCTGLRWILVHQEGRWQRRPGWAELRGVRLQGAFGAHVEGAVRGGMRPPRDLLYAVSLPHDPDCASRLFDPTATAEGNRPVALPSMRGDLRIEGLPATPSAGAESPVVIELRNTGSQVWPGPTDNEDLRVALRVRWEGVRGSASGPGSEQTIFLPQDVLPGRAASLQTWLSHPRTAGDYRLRARLAQAARGESVGLLWVREVTVVPSRQRGT
jgi:hypothetical protein